MSANPVVAAAPTAAVAANQGYSSDRPDIGTYKSTTVATLAKAGGVISSSVEANKQQQQQLEDGQIYYDSSNSSSVGNSSNNNSLSSSEIRFRGRGGLDDDWSTIKAEVIGVTASQSQQDRVHSHYALVLGLFGLLLMLVFALVSSKNTFLRCLRVRHMGLNALRRDSVMIDICEKEIKKMNKLRQKRELELERQEHQFKIMKELQKNPLPPSLSEHPPAKEPPLSASKPSFTIKSISNLLLKPANTKRSVLPSLILSVPVNPISSKVSGQVNPVPVPQTKIEVIPDQENRQKKTADAKASSHSHGKKSGKPKAPRAPPEMEMNAWAAKSKPSYKLQYMP